MEELHSHSPAQIRREGDVLYLSGTFRLREFNESLLHRHSISGITTVDLKDVERVDTGTAALLLSAYSAINPRLVNASPDVEAMFKLAIRAQSKGSLGSKKKLKGVAPIGRTMVLGWKSLMVLLEFIGGTTVAQFKTLLKPKELRLLELVVQLEQCLLQAVPVVSLVMFLIGTVIAYLFAGQIERYGANIFIVDGVSISVCREFSPVIIAIIIAGRSGSAFTAQLGTMKINEEVDALKTLGLSVMQVLILPRYLALLLSLPLLVAVGDLVGIFGGMVVAQERLGIEFSTFVQRLHDVLKTKHVIVGLVKAPVFAAFIAIIGCKMGLTVENNARSVGLNTTSTVVQSIVSVILLDAGFAVLLVELGI